MKAVVLEEDAAFVRLAGRRMRWLRAMSISPWWPQVSDGPNEERWDLQVCDLLHGTDCCMEPSTGARGVRPRTPFPAASGVISSKRLQANSMKPPNASSPLVTAKCRTTSNPEDVIEGTPPRVNRIEDIAGSVGWHDELGRGDGRDLRIDELRRNAHWALGRYPA